MLKDICLYHPIYQCVKSALIGRHVKIHSKYINGYQVIMKKFKPIKRKPTIISWSISEVFAIPKYLIKEQYLGCFTNNVYTKVKGKWKKHEPLE